MLFRSIFLTQLEIPKDVTLHCLKIAKENNILTILNPAPASDLPEEFFNYIDYFTPNETEAEFFTGLKITNENEKERIDLLFGDIYLKINKPQKAIEFYESAFMTSDEDVESLSELGLAEAYLRKGNLKESIKHAKRSLEINSDRTRGKIVLAIGLTKNAEKDKHATYGATRSRTQFM